MDQLGIDIHVLTIPAPGADRFEGQDAIEIARVANDAIAAIARQHPNGSSGFSRCRPVISKPRSTSSSARLTSSACAVSAVLPI